jgi:hypothetical protein
MTPIPQNWKIERYLLGELPESEIATFKTLESENSEFRSQIELLKKNNEELLAKYPYRDNRRQIWFIPLSAVATLLIAATALLAVLSQNNAEINTIVMDESGTRVKGLKTNLEVWRKTTDSTEKLFHNSLAKAGDLLQMRYIAEKKCYGVILSMDGNGTLTIHLSGSNGKAAELEAGKIVSLEKAYELDNAPKFETFYLITNATEFALAPVAETILQGKLPKNLQIEQITLRKL